MVGAFVFEEGAGDGVFAVDGEIELLTDYAVSGILPKGGTGICMLAGIL